MNCPITKYHHFFGQKFVLLPTQVLSRPRLPWATCLHPRSTSSNAFLKKSYCTATLPPAEDMFLFNLRRKKTCYDSCHVPSYNHVPAKLGILRILRSWKWTLSKFRENYPPKRDANSWRLRCILAFGLLSVLIVYRLNRVMVPPERAHTIFGLCGIPFSVKWNLLSIQYQ